MLDELEKEELEEEIEIVNKSFNRIAVAIFFAAIGVFTIILFQID